MSGRTPSIDDLTPEQLERLHARMAALRAGAPAADGIPRRGDAGPAPLSFAQEQIWLQHQVDGDGTLFNVPVALRLHGALDRGALRRALDEIVRRHELLRTVVELREEGPVQVVLPARGAPFREVETDGDLNAPDEALRLARAEAAVPFDLASDPPFRAMLVRVGHEDHVLSLTLHHIAQDRWSSGVLLGELAALYRAFHAGAPSPLPEPRIQYADFAAWQRDRMRGETLDRLLAYWLGRLEDAPTSQSPLPDLPRGAPPAPVKLPVRLPPATGQALRRVAREEGGTPYVVLLAAYLVLLRGYTGEDDLVVGTYVANRTRPETERLVGSLANTLVLRFRVESEDRFRDLLRRVRETVLDAQRHQDLPFERLVQALQPPREPGRTPLVRTSFNVPRAAPAHLELPGVRGEVLPVDAGGAGVDLHWVLEEWDEGIVGALEYDAALYLPETAERLAAAYLRLLDAVAVDPDAPLEALPLLASGERERVLHAWNDTRRDFPADACVHHLFAERAARTPDAVAVVHGSVSLTYAALDARAGALAHILAARGVGPDVRVGLCVQRSPELMVALLGILKAGGAYVPLDPAYPEGRLAYMLADSGARIVVADARTRAALPEFGGEVVEVGPPHPPGPPPPASEGRGENDTPDGEDRSVDIPLPHAWGRVASPSEPGGGSPPPLAPPPQAREGSTTMPTSQSSPPLVGEGWRAAPGWGASVSPDNLAYVIYTSGSTGTPKGVALTHRALVNLLRWQDGAWVHPDAADTLQFTTVSFDVSFQEIFSCWLSGGRLVLLDEDERRDPAAVLERLESGGVRRLFLPYVALQQLAETGVERGAYPPALREVQTAGEQLRVTEPIRRWFARTGAVLSNQYGPSETHVVTAHTLAGAPETWPVLPPIGRPVDNARCHVLDARGEPVPVGVPGELRLGGACLARGYLGRPDLTAERFVPDPFSGEPGARSYRTGDRARWLADGTLEFLGRADAQVKVRGYRVEPGEVEAALERMPEVGGAVAAVRQDPGGGPRLVGYVVAAPGRTVDPADLRARLREELPEYMVPSAVVLMETFPLTPSGKVDRRALPAPAEDAGSRSGRAPRTPTEEILAGIFAEVLGVERVGAGDDFFDLGGHSLLGTRVVSRVRAALGAELPLRELFEAPTVEGLAERLDARLRAGADAGASPLVPVPRDRPIPLSFAQRRLWLVDRMEPGRPDYNLPVALRLRGRLDREALARALSEVVRRHEALRTTFRDAGEEPVQVIHPALPVSLPVADLRGLPAGAREREAARVATREALRPFDLAAGPLLRSALLRLDGEEWALLFAVHHTVADGWSVGVLVREVSALYAAFVAGRPSPLPGLPVQYADFAAWQRAWLTGEALDAQVAWWRTRLVGAPPLLELPTDRPRPTVQGGAGRAVSFALRADTAAALHGLARREGATLFMALLAGWQLLLARYSGQDDVCVGTPVAGRNRVEVEGLIGFFVNTLVLRADLSGSPSFRSLLARVRETTLGAYQHQDVPFEKLVEEIAPERSLGRSPLFQAMFALQNNETADLRLGDLTLEPLGAGDPPAKFDLDLELGEEGGEVRGTLFYRAELWDRATVERMLEHLAVLLDGVAASPDLAVSEVPMMGAAERARVLEAGIAAERPYPSGLRVHDLFVAQARRTPGALALSHRGREVTYGELDRRSARLAVALRRAGVGPESRVGICLRRTPELVVAMLAVLRAGGAYVPLDPAYPRERLGYMLEDAEVGLVLTETALEGSLPDGRARRLLLDGGPGADSADSGEAPEVPESGATAECLSHVIFTSGSTGRPKGVMVRHASTVVLLHWLREVVSDEERAAVLFSTSVNFDVSVAEVFGTLCWGGRLVMVEDALELASAGEPVAYASMVPSAAAELLRSGGIPASVRTMNLGGEALPAALARDLYALGTVEKVGNLYGPTEDTTYSTYAVVERGAETVPVGRPVANTRAYVLDASLHPVPGGVPGELYLAGDGLARGYTARPDLTAERFLPDPFGAPGARMYRVMDRVRLRATGELEYLGRTDHQVKVRGFRVETGEVETVLRRHPAVRDAVVIAREDVPGERRLVAYVVPRDGRETVAAELRAHVGTHLPEYMVPSAVVAMETFPLTPNGKTDRRALPAPEWTGDGAAYVAPRTPTEEILAGIWAEVLGVERVGARDGFFDLGGHSLLAARVVSRVREALGVEPPLRAVFEEPTVAGLAAAVDALLGDGAASQAPPIVPVPRDRPLPLSFAQRRLWFVHRLDPESAAYNMPFALRVRGALHLPALEGALAEVARRHETLRTVFAVVDGEPAQVVREPAPFPVGLADLRALPAEAREAEARRLAGREALRPFDLAAGPLLRVHAVRLEEAEWALLFTLHHVVGDGWSLGVFVRELSETYAARLEGRPAVLPPLPVQYADYAAWQRAWLSGDGLDRRVAWWRERLAGAPPVLELPADRPRSAAPGHRGGVRGFSLSRDASDALRTLARREGATPFMALLAGWQLLLARYAGQEDVSVGSPVAGRSRVETEGLIGLFVGMVVLRGDLSGDPSFAALLRRTREAALGAFAHADVPFERLVEALAPGRGLDHTPLFQVVFSMQNVEIGTLRLGPAAAGTLPRDAEPARFDLSLSMQEDDDGRLSGTLLYRADRFDGRTAERILGHYAALLDSLVSAPERPVSEAGMLTPAERARVLGEWSAAGAEPADGPSVPERFAAQAARTPDAPAVVFRDLTLTYAELHRRAGSLARRLRALGVGVDDRVGILLERSEALVVAVLGILEAGAAYVPLDPGHPDARIRFVLDDAGAGAVVTQESLAGRLDGFEGEVVGPPLPPGPPPPASEGRGENDTAEGEDRSVNMPLPQTWGRVASPSEPGGGAAAAGPPPPTLAPSDPPQAREGSTTVPTSRSSPPPVGEGWREAPGWGASVSPQNLAYVVYTSGSTGTPKGVLVPHRGLARYLAWFDREVLGDEGFALPLVSRLSFDAHVRQLFPPLLRGEAVWVLPEETVADPAALLEALSGRDRVSFGGVPSLWAAMLDRIDSGEAPAPDGLRAVLLGGEALPAELVERTRTRFPGAAVWNHYGPTEATVNTTAARVDGAKRVGIGRPVAGARVYLLDAAGSPVPAGVPGEVYVGGAGVARGYLGRPDLTAERFVPDPYAGLPGARMYRSGDRARWRGDGELDYVGRVDAQVKVRGFRIEPGEVEAALRDHPAVRDAAVAVRDGRLVGYVVADGGDGGPAVGLADFLAERLPEYMVPTVFVGLDALPLSPNGKVDRGALPAPDGAGDEAEHVAPRTPEEEAVAAAFAEVLGVERVGAEDDFFALGGHSLLAPRVVSRLRGALGVELPLRALFEAPGVAGLAARVEAALRRDAGPQAPPLVPVPRNGPLPLSFAQQRLWFLDRMQPGSAAYNMPYALRLHGAADVPLLARALSAVVERHEALRTVFPEVDGEPVQAVLPAPAATLSVVDLGALPAVERERTLLRIAREEAGRPFDLARGPLLRALLVRVAPEEWGVLLTLHHVVADGWSVGVVVRELSALYEALSERRGSPLPPLPVQYPDYAVWQRSWLRGEALDAQLAWWRGKLAGAPPVLDLPTDRRRLPAPGAAGAVVSFLVPEEVAGALRETARAEGATPFMALAAVSAALLGRWAGQDDVVLGTPVAGRTHPAVEGLAGFFVNTLALRVDLRGDPGFRELLGRVREAVLGAQAHQDVPFEKLVEALAPERSPGRTPIFQATVALLDDADRELRLGPLEVEPLEAGPAAVRFDLDLAFRPEGGAIRGILSYRAELWEPATATRVSERLLALLEAAAADPDRPLTEAELLTPGERAHLTAWNRTGTGHAASGAVHLRVAETARRTPDAVAVRHAGGTLTYAELAASAGRLAARLREHGVGPDTRVAVFAERGPELVVGLLAVLAAGGAYLPLDPGYPAERLAYMLADADVKVLLAQGGLRDRLPEHRGAVVLLDGAARVDGATDAEDFRPAEPVSPASLAYVIYTSGSTGRPKAVAVPHGALASHTAWMQRAFPLAPGDRVLQKTPLSFDASVWEFWAPLTAGATLVVAPPDAHRDPAALGRAVEREGITVLQAVPSLLRAMLVEGELERCGSLARLFCGGEALPRDLADRVSAALPAELVNLYGPAEACIDATAHVHRGVGAGATVPVGRPVDGMRAHVLDARGAEVPPGVPGELYLAGSQLARGYLGRPDLTAGRFLPDPFSPEPGGRTYRTGDRVRWLADGSLEFLGRADGQVKVRGARVEPGEIEAALREHPLVRDAAVVAAGGDTAGGHRLVAYHVPTGMEGPSSAALRAHLAGMLPEHMVPAAFLELDALPLTPGGKVDRLALAAAAPTTVRRGYVPPRTGEEERVAGIWEEVLGIERVGAADSFFELGGHSLLAVKVVTRIREATGVEVPLRVLFEEPTVAGIAAWLAARSPEDALEGWEIEAEEARIAELSDEEVEALLRGL